MSIIKLLLLALLPAALADSVKTTSTCRTKGGTKSQANVPSTTNSVTTTLSAKRTVTSYPTVTVTPSTTRTIKQKSIVFLATRTTTLPPPAQSATVTEVYTEIYSDRTYASPSITVTETSYVPFTTTIDNAFNPFTAIQDDPEIRKFSGGNPKAKRDAPAPYAPRAHLQARQASTTAVGGSLQSGSVVLQPSMYPQSVSCVVSVRSYVTSTSTVAGTVARTSKLPTPSTTVTTTVTSKVIATVYGTIPGTTVTTTSTTTVSTTETLDPGPTTLQVTATDNSLPQATAYSQCQSNNQLLHGPQGPTSAWVFLSSYDNLQFSFLTYATPEECCAECARKIGCTQWVHVYGFGCFAPVPGNGNAGGVFFDWNMTTTVPIGVFGNGAGGRWGYGGDLETFHQTISCDQNGCFQHPDGPG